jgi:hypothetical protein
VTVQSLPWAIQGQSHPAEVARNAVAALFGVPVAAHTAAASVTTAGGGHGVVGAGDLAVTQNGTPNMSVNVAAGRAVIRSGESASILAGCWTFLNDATVNVAVAAADPTNPRRDLVIAQVRDANYSGASNDARLTVVTGTPAGSPADPAVPANALVLARIQVAAAASSITNANITDLRTRAYALGGVAVAAAAAGLPSGASQWAGLLGYVSAADRPSGSGVMVPQASGVPAAPGLYEYHNRWNPPWNLPWGIMGYAQITANGANNSGTATVSGLSVTFTAAANRRYKITIQCIEGVQVGAGVSQIQIWNGTGAQLNAVNVARAAGTADGAMCVGFDTPSAGSVTYNFRTFTSGTTYSVSAASSAPAFILVEDVGPNGTPA